MAICPCVFNGVSTAADLGWPDQPATPLHGSHYQQHRLLRSRRAKCLGRFDQQSASDQRLATRRHRSLDVAQPPPARQRIDRRLLMAMAAMSPWVWKGRSSSPPMAATGPFTPLNTGIFPASLLVTASFVALADGFLYTSPDGITWTNRVLPNSGSLQSSLTSRSAQAVLSGAGNALLSSDDGISWIEHTDQPHPSATRLRLLTATGSFLIHTSNRQC